MAITPGFVLLAVVDSVALLQFSGHASTLMTLAELFAVEVSKKFQAIALFVGLVVDFTNRCITGNICG